MAGDLLARLGMPARRPRRAGGPLPDHLSRREAEVLRLLAAGMTNREIAGALFLSERTVTNHLTHIFGKIGVANRAAATAYALRHGLARKREWELPPIRAGAPRRRPASIERYLR